MFVNNLEVSIIIKINSIIIKNMSKVDILHIAIFFNSSIFAALYRLKLNLCRKL